MTDAAPGAESLRQLLRGYFHQDFLAEYGGIEAAARAYRSEAARDERRRAARQLRALLDSADTLPALQSAFAALGSSWRPRDRRSVERVLAVIEAD